MKKTIGFRGWRAAPFVYIVEGFQSTVYTSFALNLFTYAFMHLHYSPADASQVLNNFSGTTTLLTLLAGILSDTYIPQFTGILIGEAIGAIGCIILTISALMPKLHPPPCPLLDPSCIQPTGNQKAFFFFGLYVLAVGLANIRPNTPALGASQFDESDPEQEKQLPSYFNLFFCCTCLGALPAVTVLAYIQEHKNIAWGFAIPAILLSSSILVLFLGAPYRARERRKSPLIATLQVFVAALRKLRNPTPPVENLYEETDSEAGKTEHFLPHTHQFLFLDKAAIRTEDSSPWMLCTVTQVEEAKAVIRMLPIFACTIIVSCILSQLQTFTLSQGNTLDRKIKNFEIPLPSLATIPILSIIILLPLYDRVFVPVLRRFTRRDRGLSHLERLGLGLFFCTLSMVVAALVETRRLRVARRENQLDNPVAVLSMGASWLIFQFFVFAIGEMFTISGLLDFFYSQSPENMKTMGISLINVSMSFGYFLSSAIVTLVNQNTKPDWLPPNINRGKVNSFYWLLSVLGAINLLNYFFWAWWYKPSELLLLPV